MVHDQTVQIIPDRKQQLKSIHQCYLARIKMASGSIMFITYATYDDENRNDEDTGSHTLFVFLLNKGVFSL